MKKFDDIDNKTLLEDFEMLIYQEQQTDNIATKKYRKILSDIEDYRIEILNRLDGVKNE